jgi:hypothetical protein
MQTCDLSIELGDLGHPELCPLLLNALWNALVRLLAEPVKHRPVGAPRALDKCETSLCRHGTPLRLRIFCLFSALLSDRRPKSNPAGPRSASLQVEDIVKALMVPLMMVVGC